MRRNGLFSLIFIVVLAVGRHPRPTLPLPATSRCSASTCRAGCRWCSSPPSRARPRRHQPGDRDHPPAGRRPRRRRAGDRPPGRRHRRPAPGRGGPRPGARAGRPDRRAAVPAGAARRSRPSLADVDPADHGNGNGRRPRLRPGDATTDHDRGDHHHGSGGCQRGRATAWRPARWRRRFPDRGSVDDHHRPPRRRTTTTTTTAAPTRDHPRAGPAASTASSSPRPRRTWPTNR